MNDYHKIYKFDNGYGASVVSHFGSYGGKDGLFEVAVLKNGKKGGKQYLCYDTPITSDVVGWLDFAGVADILNKIKAL